MMENMNENREFAVKLSGVKKMYKLGQIGGGTLQADLQSWWAKVRGKEDPNTKIGQKERLVGQTFMALNGIDLTIYKGEAVGIIGGNGAGKSTMLKLLSRVTAPTEGEIEIDGRIASMLEVGTGFNGEMTGRENVYMNGAILGMTKQEIDAKMDQIIEFSEVKDFIDTPVKRYSSGMFVKLAFSVAAHLDSEIMIMDEVLAVGDMAFQKKCLDKMREAATKEGRTVLYVSHNMNTIRRLCDRCIVLDKGKVIFEGDVEEAIHVYLNDAKSETTVLTNLEDKTRPEDSVNKIKMHTVHFLDTDDCVYEQGDKIKFAINWSILEPLKDIRFRMTVRFEDDTPVGITRSEIIKNDTVGKNITTTFMFDASLIAEGRYFLSLTFYQNDEVGNSVTLDHIARACSFEIISNIDDEKKLVWGHQWWGSILFPDLVELEGEYHERR